MSVLGLNTAFLLKVNNCTTYDSQMLRGAVTIRQLKGCQIKKSVILYTWSTHHHWKALKTLQLWRYGITIKKVNAYLQQKFKLHYLIHHFDSSGELMQSFFRLIFRDRKHSRFRISQLKCRKHILKRFKKILQKLQRKQLTRAIMKNSHFLIHLSSSRISTT